MYDFLIAHEDRECWAYKDFGWRSTASPWKGSCIFDGERIKPVSSYLVPDTEEEWDDVEDEDRVVTAQHCDDTSDVMGSSTESEEAEKNERERRKRIRRIIRKKIRVLRRRRRRRRRGRGCFKLRSAKFPKMLTTWHNGRCSTHF